MVWPWTLTLWPKNVIRSSVSQDAPMTKVWRKSINRYWRYSGNMKIWDAFGHAVTLNFDLLTPKSNLFISVPRCNSDKSLTKIRQQILEISRKHKTTTWITDGRTDGQRHGRTTRKYIASAGAYRRRRLKNYNNHTLVTMQRVDARRASVRQQFDLKATTKPTIQSPEVAHDWTSSVTASTTILAAKDCLVSVRMCCQLCPNQCLLSSDATTPSSEEYPQSNLSQQHSPA